jgi:RNA polymerase sigma-70 factor (ECF subfamily)
MTLRARHRVQEDRPRFVVNRRTARAVVGRFITALRDADLDGLRAVLAEDVVQISDGGNRAPAAARPVAGIDNVVRLLLGLRKKFWENVTLQPASVNGLPGLTLARANGLIFAAVGLDFEGERISGIYSVVNPDKLVHANRAPRDRIS